MFIDKIKLPFYLENELVVMTSYDDMIKQGRKFIKAHDFNELPLEGEFEPHQKKGTPHPPLQKPYSDNGILISLISPEEFTIDDFSLIKAIGNRQSRRKFREDFLTLEELSFLLWATQGVREVSKISTKRMVPSGRARQGFETYLLINRVKGLSMGIYRYLPIEHKLLLISKEDHTLPERIIESCFNQKFIGNSAVVFVWAAYPYRMEWSFSVRAHKDILIEAGHICQNLYLACEAINCGTCAIGLYDQNLMDNLIGVDGENEFTAYLAPVGRI